MRQIWKNLHAFLQLNHPDCSQQILAACCTHVPQLLIGSEEDQRGCCRPLSCTTGSHKGLCCHQRRSQHSRYPNAQLLPVQQLHPLPCLCATSHSCIGPSPGLHGGLQVRGPLPPFGRGLQAAHATLQGPEDPQIALYAEQLADLLGCYTERLEEARTVLLEALEVSMVSVTLLWCLVLLASAPPFLRA